MNDAQKALEQWLEITGVKEGDKVLVVDGAESWRASFGLKPVQDEFIGATGTVTLSACHCHPVLSLPPSHWQCHCSTGTVTLSAWQRRITPLRPQACVIHMQVCCIGMHCCSHARLDNVICAHGIQNESSPVE